jgi:hypothetical protein
MNALVLIPLATEAQSLGLRWWRCPDESFKWTAAGIAFLRSEGLEEEFSSPFVGQDVERKAIDTFYEHGIWPTLLDRGIIVCQSCSDNQSVSLLLSRHDMVLVRKQFHFTLSNESKTREARVKVVMIGNSVVDKCSHVASWPALSTSVRSHRPLSSLSAQQWSEFERLIHS